MASLFQSKVGKEKMIKHPLEIESGPLLTKVMDSFKAIEDTVKDIVDRMEEIESIVERLERIEISIHDNYARIEGIASIITDLRIHFTKDSILQDKLIADGDDWKSVAMSLLKRMSEDD